MRAKDLREYFPELQPSGELTALNQRLEYYRRAVIFKIEDLSDLEASSRVFEATDLTVGGIVKHLAWA